MERRVANHERDKRRREKQREQGRKFNRLVDRAVAGTDPFPDSHKGPVHMVVDPPIRVSSWTDENGVGQVSYNEVLMDGAPVFLSTTIVQGQTEISSQILVYRPGPWERILRTLANTREQTAAR